MAGEYTGEPIIDSGWYDCQVCGFTYQKKSLKKRFDGALVCDKCWEAEHPNDLKRKGGNLKEEYKGY